MTTDNRKSSQLEIYFQSFEVCAIRKQRMTTEHESSGKSEWFVKIPTGDMFFAIFAENVSTNQCFPLLFFNRVKKNAQGLSFYNKRVVKVFKFH